MRALSQLKSLSPDDPSLSKVDKSPAYTSPCCLKLLNTLGAHMVGFPKDPLAEALAVVALPCLSLALAP